MPVPPDARLAPAESVLTRPVGDELVLLNVETEYYFGLDPVGATMWDAICEAGTLNAAVTTLQGAYDVEPATLASDLQELAEQLVEQKLLDVRAD